MLDLVTDVSVLPARMKRELIRGEHARAEFAIRAQTALKEAMDQMGPYRHIEGIGVKRATIHPELAARIRVKFGIKALHDPDFIKTLLRDNPFLRVQTVPGKLTLRVNGLREASSRRLDPPSREAPARQGEDLGFQERPGCERGASLMATRTREIPRCRSAANTERVSVLSLTPGQCVSGHESGPATPGSPRQKEAPCAK